MKLFKSVDEKLNDIGFVKVEDGKCIVCYKRENTKYHYIQCLYFLYKASGNHIVQSCQKDVNSDNFNNVVGLTAYETKLVLKKMHQLGWK